MKRKERITLNKKRPCARRYSREMLKYYKTLAIRQRAGERFLETEKFLKELNGLVEEHMEKEANSMLLKAS